MTDKSAANQLSTNKKIRISPVPESEWTPGQRELLEPSQKAGTLFNVFTTMARNEKLYRAWLPFAGFILRGSSLPPRDRELVILRIGWLCKAEYEWGHHKSIAKNLGVTDEEIARVAEGPDAKGWTEFESHLLRAVDELRANARIGDATWQALSKVYDEKLMMELVFTVGEYNLVSMALNSFGVQLEKEFEGFTG